MQKYHTQGSRRLYQATLPYLVDGVGSSFHVPSYRDYPIAMTRGKGSKLYDVDGNEYIDYILGFGPMLLGHCPPAVDRAVAEQLKRGTHFSAPTPELGALSRRLTQVIPAAEKVVYQNSGTEVVMYALRLARAFTGRYKIVKFEGQYHGWSDEEKVSIDADTVADLGPRENPRKILPTKGQRLSSADDLILLPWNDLEALDRTLTQRREEIAAVLMEPCMCDSGPILPQPGYLAGVRELTRRHVVLLIFDEVITGFRLALGGAQAYYGVTPDIATFAKAIASGYPFGAVVGRRDVMDCGVPASGNSPSPGSMPGWRPWASSWRTASRPWGRSTAANSTSATWGVFSSWALATPKTWGTSGTGSPRPTWPSTSALWPGARITASASPTAGGGSISPPPTPRRTSAAPWRWPTRFWERWNRREFNMIDAMQWFQLNGKEAMVTGGAAGLCYAMAEGLHLAGAEVVLVDRSPAVGEAAARLGAQGAPVHGVQGDLSHWEGLPALYDRVLAALRSRVDILVNGAGIQYRCPAEDSPPERWQQILRINLDAVFRLAQLAGRTMLAQGGGRIINVASMTSFFGSEQIPAYAASKGAVAQLTKALSNEWAGRGVNVNAIAPGYMVTQLTADMQGKNPAQYAEITGRIPMHRWGQPEDLQGAVVFLASPAAAYVTGAILPVDGGYLGK